MTVNGQFSCPPPGSFVAVYGQFLVSAVTVRLTESFTEDKLAKLSADCRGGQSIRAQSDCPLGLLRDDHMEFFSLDAPVQLAGTQVRRVVAACQFGPRWPSMSEFFTTSPDDVLRSHLGSRYRLDAPSNIAMRRFVDLPHHVAVEAKGMRTASFQPEQLAREYLAVVREAETRDPVMLLILGSPPPVRVSGQGLWEIGEAIKGQLPRVLRHTGADESFDDLVKRIPEVVSWITWAELDAVVASQLSSIKIDDPSLHATVERLATALSAAIAIHSKAAKRSRS